MRKALKAAGAKRAILYIRVSTEEQAQEGVSLDNQLARAQAWAEQHGYEVSAELTFTDAGLSAKRADNRPGLQAALTACQCGDALVVYSLSRLARSTQDAIAISERLAKQGSDLVSLTENLDTTTATGKMVFGVLAVLAQFERDLVSERTSSALQHKRRNGEAYSRPVYGYERVGNRLELCSDEQAVVARIQTLRADGMSYDRIAKQLTTEQVPTKRGGLKWYASTVHSVVEGLPQPQAA